MATLNIFQQYSQPENTTTNNVLLMFSLIYDVHPRYYEELVGGLIEDSDAYGVIPSFNQQVSNKGDGFIDGHITLNASSIIIETKLDALEWIDKLLKYTKSFEDHQVKILFHLSRQRYDDDALKNIVNRIAENPLKGIRFKSITFQDLLDQLSVLQTQYPFEQQINRIYQHFYEYCANMNLLPDTRIWLRAMACGQSYHLNVKHRFYFDLARRGYSAFSYLGIYKDKSVRHIGTIENTIEADWDEVTGLHIRNSQHHVTDEQKARLEAAIKDSVDEDWWIQKDHRFFLFKEFCETDFRKVSPGGIFRVRYFNLEDYNIKKGEILSNLCQELKKHIWK